MSVSIDSGRRCPCPGARLVTCAAALVLSVFILAPSGRAGAPAAPTAPQVLTVSNGDLQSTIDAAPPHSTIICNRNDELVLSAPIVVARPLTIRGLNARLPDGLGKTPLVVIESEGVVFTDFRLQGNAGTVDRSQRSALIEIRCGRFRVEDGEFHDSTKDGVMINPGGSTPRIITGGVVRNITGYNIDRDVVSISAGQAGALPVEHLLVENVRCFGSPLRGAVEVSNGSRYITVRTVYAEDCVYAVDIQDHGEPAQINHDILVEDVHAKRCQHAVRFAMQPFGHRDITLNHVTAENCGQPLPLKNADRLLLSDIRILGFDGECPVTVTNCDDVVLRDVFMSDVTCQSRAIHVENCNNVLINGLLCRGKLTGLDALVRYCVSADETFSGLDVSGVLVADFKGPEIAFENVSAHGQLTVDKPAAPK